MGILKQSDVFNREIWSPRDKTVKPCFSCDEKTELSKTSLNLCPPRTPEWGLVMQLIKDKKIKSLRIFRDLMSNGWYSYETKRIQTDSKGRRPHAARGREYKMRPWSHQILERARKVSFSLQLLKGE